MKRGPNAKTVALDIILPVETERVVCLNYVNGVRLEARWNGADALHEKRVLLYQSLRRQHSREVWHYLCERLKLRQVMTS